MADFNSCWWSYTSLHWCLSLYSQHVKTFLIFTREPIIAKVVHRGSNISRDYYVPILKLYKQDRAFISILKRS